MTCTNDIPHPHACITLHRAAQPAAAREAARLAAVHAALVPPRRVACDKPSTPHVRDERCPDCVVRDERCPYCVVLYTRCPDYVVLYMQSVLIM